MSNYPGSLDTLLTLLNAADGLSTRLIAPMTIGAVAAGVASSTGWTAGMVATIESEQMLVTAVAANLLTVTRAYGGTSAATHAQNKTVSNFVDAVYHNALASAVLAIETALGANLANTLSSVLPVSFGSTTGNGIPGADNPYTAPNVLSVRDGTVAAPQALDSSPSAVFQRVNALPADIANAFVFDGSSTNAANADQGCITLTSVIHDQTVARGGSAVRAVLYADTPAAASALVSATISGGSVIVVTSTPHYAHVGNGIKFQGTAGMAGLDSTRVVTQIDSATQLRFAVGALAGGPGSGGTVTVVCAYYAFWDSNWKLVGGVRVVGCESDMNNQFADAGASVAAQDATFNRAFYSSGFNNTVGLYLDSGDGSSHWYHPIQFGANALVAAYPYIDSSAGPNTVDFAWVGNNQFVRWSDSSAGRWPILGLDATDNFRISAPTNQFILIGPNLTSMLLVSAAAVSHRTATTQTKATNYIASEATGANNAIIGALLDATGTAVALANGLQVVQKLAHTLQAGANTYNFNGNGVVAIKSSRNPANNIGTAYAATGTITLLYDATGPYWLDVSQ